MVKKMEQLLFPFMTSFKMPEWYTDSFLRLNYKVSCESKRRCGLPTISYKEYVELVKEGKITPQIAPGRG